jgi:hypothetical protein
MWVGDSLQGKPKLISIWLALVCRLAGAGRKSIGQHLPAPDEV